MDSKPAMTGDLSIVLSLSIPPTLHSLVKQGAPLTSSPDSYEEQWSGKSLADYTVLHIVVGD